ncbi:hypothetical protein PFTANZ_06413 [Plasmodium falciparum Tanzania (2000708)]|uniref:Uncharacterized protein n=1 Tax=Plasmodium falciparum Tanzania (2000708) TaxID=1036725 RepID=A0A024VX34_PLAFA|nr:hypothetical protein PFTANZ_06413 [Plasmodium falciparum Tanzania (2000708)]
MVMRGRPGGHRSGAGSGGAGSNKCTEVANGKHNTKIDKLLQHELNDATKCKNCEQQPAGGGDVARADFSPPPRSPKKNEPDSKEQEEEEDEDEEDEEGEEEENDNVGGAADTK